MTEHQSDGGLSRRTFIAGAAVGAATGLSSACAASTQLGGQSARLITLPTRVFKVQDPRRRTELWFYSLVVETGKPANLDARALTLDYFSGGQHLKRETYDAAALQPLMLLPEAPATDPFFTGPPRPVLLPDGSSPPSPIYRPFGIRLRNREATASSIDRVRAELTIVGDGIAREERIALDIPVQTYEQRTKLIFPFKGNGIVTAGGAANDGHGNRSGQFAVDAMGMSENYAVQVGPAFEKNTDLVGFGRPIIAPADGVIVHVRSDRPDQPEPGTSNEAYHVEELKGGGDGGNHVIIDHGNGEFSKIGHMQAGSVIAKRGERVRQGQALGRLGNSGDSFAPHVHYQLQTGPDWQYSDALPYRFSNVSAYPLVKGVFFSAD